DPAHVDDRPGSVGKAMPNCEAHVVDEYGRRAGPKERGELVVRGANVMRGYWRRPDLTSQRLHPSEITGENILHTGDHFRTDEDGFLYFLGRSDDIFKCR